MGRDALCERDLDGIAYLFWYRGLRVLGPTRTAVYGNLQPVIAIIVAWLFLKEAPTLVAGCRNRNNHDRHFF